MRLECKYDELIPLKDVEKRWHPDNENSHPEEQVRALAKVIGKIGIRHAIHISKLSGKIAGGHGRFLAFQKLGYDEVPVIWENFKDEIEEINYRASDNIGQYAEFNNQEYVQNLEKLDIDIHNVDLEEFGIIDFTPEVEVLEPQSDEDATPEVKHDPITKRGDVWLLGNHRVKCGDSTMIDDVEKLMNGEKADMVFTDPPYGINENCDRDFASPTRKAKGNSFKQIAGDENTDVAVSFCNYWLGIGVDKYVIWGANHFCHALPESPQWLVWDKREEEKERDMNSDVELAWVSSGKKSARIFRHKWKGMIKASEHGQARVHPTQKPIALAEFSFKEYDAGGLIFDGFLGSGSTLIACEKTNRKCYGMELDPHYCDIIVERWQNYTGKKAILESTGDKYDSLRNLAQKN